MTVLSRASGFLSIAVLLCAPALPAGAQSLPASSLAGSATPASAAFAADSSRPVSITLPTVTASGAPRSYQVVSIPVPADLARRGTIDVEIVPRGEFTVLGARKRTFALAGQKPRFGVTIGIPASAIAGRVTAAEVRFSTAGATTLVVPIEIDVSLVRKIVLRPASSPLTAQAGNDVILPFEIANTGNAVEKISADIDLPSGWASRDVHQSHLEISPGETVKRRVRLKVPASDSRFRRCRQPDRRSSSSHCARAPTPSPRKR
jgi:hypothetical protein